MRLENVSNDGSIHASIAKNLDRLKIRLNTMLASPNVNNLENWLNVLQMSDTHSSLHRHESASHSF